MSEDIEESCGFATNSSLTRASKSGSSHFKSSVVARLYFFNQFSNQGQGAGDTWSQKWVAYPI